MSRRTKEDKLAALEEQRIELRRKLAIEKVPGIKEAAYLAKALARYEEQFPGLIDDPSDLSRAATKLAGIVEKAAEALP